MSTILNDIKYALRSLRRTPVFTVAVVVTLALGIGANTAIFSVIDAVLLRPLGYRDPERLVQVWETNPEAQAQFGVSQVPTSNPNYQDWKAQATSFDGIGAFRYNQFTLAGTEHPEQVWGARLSAGMLPMLGIDPMLGRGFHPEEEEPGKDGVVLLGNAVWQRQFGADPGIVGRTVTVDGNPRVVIGVMPAGFRFPPSGSYPILGKVRTDIWVPVVHDTTSRGARSFGVIARLKPGVTVEGAAAEMSRIASGLAETYPGANRNWTTIVVPLKAQLTDRVRAPLGILLAAVGFVLLIACANVANLLLARAATRRREFAVRAALGAGRGRIVRQLLTESVLLAVLGGGLGVLLAAWGVGALRGLLPADFPRLGEVAINGRALFFTSLLSALTGLGFGLVPALAASRPGLRGTLSESGRGNTQGPAARRSRVALVTLQVSLALVLLVAAGLLIRSFGRLLDVDPGFVPNRVVTSELSLPRAKYPDGLAATGLFQQLLEQLRAAPGVTEASLASVMPLADQEEFDGFFIEGRQYDPNLQPPSARWLVVDPRYFATMGITVEKGRSFAAADDGNADGVAIINRRMAEQFWPNADPLGQRITLGSATNGPWRTVVGIVDDVRHSGLSQDPKPEMYTPFLQTPWPAMNVVVRSSTLDVAAITNLERDALRGLDAGIGLGPVATMSSLVAASVAPARLNMLLLSLLGGLALLLAALGVYGVVNYSVTTRTGEMGLRMALGAEPGDVVRMVLGEGARLALAGTVVGLVAAWAVTRLLASLLFGVSATDPVTFVVVPVALALVTMLASWLPARRASRVDPMEALRAE